MPVWNLCRRAGGVLLCCATFLVAAPHADAQGDPAMEAQQDYRNSMVSAIEETLFNVTQKTSKVIFLKEFRAGDSATLYCGVAFFGSRPQKFLINMVNRDFLRPPTPAQWASEGCNADGGATLIDLR